MPVRQLVPERSEGHLDLVHELREEWDHPSPARAEPVILEERDRTGQLVHVYVIWNKWASVDRAERSEIVMDAALQRLPQEQALNITIAMGLTPDEARRMGVKFE